MALPHFKESSTPLLEECNGSLINDRRTVLLAEIQPFNWQRALLILPDLRLAVVQGNTTTDCLLLADASLGSHKNDTLIAEVNATVSSLHDIVDFASSGSGTYDCIFCADLFNREGLSGSQRVLATLVNSLLSPQGTVFLDHLNRDYRPSLPLLRTKALSYQLEGQDFIFETYCR